MTILTDEQSLHQDVDAKGLAEMGKAVLEIEAKALTGLIKTIDMSFVRAVRSMLNCEGRVIVLGMGKSGHIGGKVAATLASTGTPAFFVHPGEASHGDMGMITERDVVLAFSNSGETEELTVLLPVIKRLGIPLVAVTGSSDSTLAMAATVHVCVEVKEEACPLGLAPTSSTTAALAMGDALAIAMLQTRGFTERDFARAHPGGVLGRRLLLKIDDLMHKGDTMPVVHPETRLSDAVVEMNRSSLGLTAVIDETGRVEGIFTDGDLRRIFERNYDVREVQIKDVMTRNCRTLSRGALAAEALHVMQDQRINALLVLDDKKRLIGVLNMHDLLRARVL